MHIYIHSPLRNTIIIINVKVNQTRVNLLNRRLPRVAVKLKVMVWRIGRRGATARRSVADRSGEKRHRGATPVAGDAGGAVGTQMNGIGSAAPLSSTSPAPASRPGSGAGRSAGSRRR